MFSALVGAALACATLAAGVYFIVMQKAEPVDPVVPWIGWTRRDSPCSALLVVGLVLAVIPTLITTRKYLRV